MQVFIRQHFLSINRSLSAPSSTAREGLPPAERHTKRAQRCWGWQGPCPEALSRAQATHSAHQPSFGHLQPRGTHRHLSGQPAAGLATLTVESSCLVPSSCGSPELCRPRLKQDLVPGRSKQGHGDAQGSSYLCCGHREPPQAEALTSHTSPTATSAAPLLAVTARPLCFTPPTYPSTHHTTLTPRGASRPLRGKRFKDG